MRHYAGLPLTDFGLCTEVEFRDLPFDERRERHVTEYCNYEKKTAYGFDTDRISEIINEHGAPHGVYFEYSDNYMLDGNSGRHKNLSVFTFSDEDDEPIELPTPFLTEEQRKALEKCAKMLLEDGLQIPKIGLYSAQSTGWKQVEGRNQNKES